MNRSSTPVILALRVYFDKVITDAFLVYPAWMGETITCRILVVIHLGRPRRIWGKDCEAGNQIEMTVFSGGI
jgi:hypothetical protein